MYKYILSAAGNINWMAIFALLTFVFIFGMSVYMILRRDKGFIDKMAHLPLEDGTQPSSSINQ
ncbi:MAG: hypothetical protein KDC44_17470 [Phaeodactylibacter sp.]|nr:hypothetical protein [Phaeodactylibacter sp.]